MSEGIDVERNGEGGAVNKVLKKLNLTVVIMAALGLILAGFIFIIVSSQFDEHTIAYHVFRDLGIAAFISGLLGTAYDSLIRTAHEEWTRKNFAEIMENANVNLVKNFRERDSQLKRLQEMSEAGLVGIHRRRYVEMLEKEFEERPKKVQILETWTGFRIQLQEWISGVIENGAVVEILLLDPTSEHVKYRSQALGTNVKGEIENDLVCLGRTVRELEQKNPEYKDKLQIKVYNATPVVNMYRFGDTRIVGMYLWGTDSTRGPQLRMKACNDCQKAFLIEPLDKHFNKIWQAEPIPGSGNKIVTKPVEVEEAQSGTESVEVTESKVIVEV